MKSLRFLDRRAGYSLASLGLLLGVIAPAALPAFASASTQMQGRSITMSSAIASDTGASYKVAFTPTTDFRTIYVDFCAASPVVGDACAVPTDMTTTGATPSWTSSNKPGGTLTATMTTNGDVKYVGTSDTSTLDPVELTIAGIQNPSTVGTFYARIYTYGATDTYASNTDPGASVEDEGGIALSTTDTLGVQAAVRETLTFCVFGSGDSDVAPQAGCTDTAGSGGTPQAPSVTLGQGSPQALTTTDVSHGKDYAQISTNASQGAIVYMKNSNSCGGLMRVGAASCDIAPANSDATASADFGAGTADFGVKLGTPAAATAVGGGTDTHATGAITPNAVYDFYSMPTSAAATSTADDSSAAGGLTQDVTSTYGGYLFGTHAAPVADQNVPLTFGASSSNVTPAGMYKATINLIAVGTY